jgi:hypothetical protein
MESYVVALVGIGSGGCGVYMKNDARLSLILGRDFHFEFKGTDIDIAYDRLWRSGVSCDAQAAILHRPVATVDGVAPGRISLEVVFKQEWRRFPVEEAEQR